ncbi:MAG: zinc ribbon domain-containing protein [Candidatus Dormiibacterota bacterium]|nr:zinc ribbon domain-containing protein [Candidatus Dormibacteraeota bacterium]
MLEKFGSLIVIGGLYAGVLWLALAYWALKDARSRSDNPTFHLFAMGLNLVFPLLGLLVYMLMRPSITMAEHRSLELEAAALSQTAKDEDVRPCPACGREIESDFVLCPYCQTRFAKRCPECHKSVRLGWRLCPYCATSLEVAVPRAAAGQSRR